MPYASGEANRLPVDATGILALAARSMFHLFSSLSQGIFLVARGGRIVWVNEGYQRFLPALCFTPVDQFLGQMVEDAIPNTQMRRGAGKGRADLDRFVDQQDRHLRCEPQPALAPESFRGGRRLGALRQKAVRLQLHRRVGALQTAAVRSTAVARQSTA